MKPIIGITSNYDSRDTVGLVTQMGADGQDWDFLASDYAAAVQEAGGIPLIIPQCREPETILELPDRLDGLLLSGGGDIDPRYFGEEAKPCSHASVPRRDEEEILLARAAFAKKLPVLGICRGLQVMTVALGGTLYQDLAEEMGAQEHFIITSPRNEATHEVSLKEGSRLREIFGTGTLGVNSFHHQGAKALPENAAVTALSPDGVAEAVEFEGGHPFTLAVQWHPEMMFDSERQKKLFRAFIEAARK